MSESTPASSHGGTSKTGATDGCPVLRGGWQIGAARARLCVYPPRQLRRLDSAKPGLPEQVRRIARAPSSQVLYCAHAWRPRQTPQRQPVNTTGLSRMLQKFTDPRLVSLNDDDGFVDNGMRRALCEALEPGEAAIATYSVSAHIWVQAVLTDRALLLVKGAVRAKVTRAPLPLEIARAPARRRNGVRVRTPLGEKTLWGSKLDPEARLLLGASQSMSRTTDPARAASDRRSRPSKNRALSIEPEAVSEPAPDREFASSPEHTAPTRAARQTRQQARQAAGAKPRRPRRRRVRKQWVGFAPSSTIWDLVDNCVKCGRPLTDPRSRQARVGTKCIRIYGSQQRKIPNPRHAAWIDKKSKSDAAYIAEKVRADAEYARAKTAYDEARAEWIRVRSGR